MPNPNGAFSSARHMLAGSTALGAAPPHASYNLTTLDRGATHCVAVQLLEPLTHAKRSSRRSSRAQGSYVSSLAAHQPGFGQCCWPTATLRAPPGTPRGPAVWHPRPERLSASAEPCTCSPTSRQVGAGAPRASTAQSSRRDRTRARRPPTNLISLSRRCPCHPMPPFTAVCTGIYATSVMSGGSRKRKQAGRKGALSRAKRARGVRGRPGQPQPISCRVEGCQEPLTPGYHKVGCQRRHCELCMVCRYMLPATAHVYRIGMS